MEHPRKPRTATTLALSAVVLAALAGCGSGGVQGAGVTATDLGEAQLTEFSGTKPVPDQTESGAYAKLDTVQQTEKLREATTLDKPACLDAVNQWGGLKEVRSAPTSLATFSTGRTTITHMLVHLPGEPAKKALDINPPKDCSAYQSTSANGTKSTYSMRTLDLPTFGEESRAFLVETKVGKQRVKMYNLVYRHGEYLGTTTVLGPEDAEEMLREFTEAAVERESEVLS
ncbi:hypothetical protein CLV63_112221 [Murinocardiopsis flavida]|uniref:PknH-like protein n=1 Tax=Murinocardiopsis flavida TaxID=645275 RepID=A0A2P8DGM9_9ACTN|nr:hypothetical protein [Murinocardiopsis flavida]PSK96336.1 hypothetical protein CLV63_112221 [Murinocardiopsis flavida]